MSLELKTPKQKYVCISDDDKPEFIVCKLTKFKIGETYHMEKSQTSEYNYVYDSVDNYCGIFKNEYVSKNFIKSKGTFSSEIGPHCKIVSNDTKASKANNRYVCIKDCVNKPKTNNVFVSTKTVNFEKGTVFIINPSHHNSEYSYIYTNSETEIEYICCVLTDFVKKNFNKIDYKALTDVDTLFDSVFFEKETI